MSEDDPMAAVQRRWVTVATSLFAFVAGLGLLARYEFQTAGIVGYDGHYHIKYAWLLRTQGWIGEFPWAARSLWADGFADKEILYHVLLVPFSAFPDMATGMKWAAVLLGSAALAVFAWVLCRSRVRFPALWVLLLLASGPHFLTRVAAPRPHVLSLLLLLLSMHFILQRRRVALAVTTLVYALSYTGFHLSLSIAVLASVAIWLERREVDWKTPAAVAGATLLGVLVNPYFPDNLRLFWIQNFAVPWMNLFSGIDLHQGPELDPFSVREPVLSLTAVTLPYLAALVLTVFVPRRLDTRTRQLFLVSLALIGMTCLSRRFTEYSVPFTLWFCAALLTDHAGALDLRALWRHGGPGRRRLVLGAAGIAALLAVLHLRSYAETAPEFRAVTPDLSGAADWISRNTPEDSLIFTCDWDDAPQLFRYDHRNRYLVFLDPAFMYFRDPAYWAHWTDLANGDYAGTTYEELAREFEFGVCTRGFRRMYAIADADPRIEIVYEDDDAFVFRLDLEHPEIDLDEFLKLPAGL